MHMGNQPCSFRNIASHHSFYESQPMNLISRLHCVFQTTHRDSFSTAAPNPFLLPSLAADTSSPLPGSFAPQNLFERARHSTSSNTLFTLSLTLRHFFPPLLLPTHSFLVSKDTLRAHPNHASPCRLLSLRNDALTNPQPQSLPSMLSTPLSPFQLVPGFRPLLSGAFFPNSVSLGSSAIVKVPEQVGAAKPARHKVGNGVLRKGFLFQENPSEQPNPHTASKRFPGTGSQARVPSRRFPSKVPRNRFPSKVPKQGSQAEVYSKVPRQGSQARLPGTDSQARVPRKRFPSRVPEGFEEEVPRQGSQERGSKQGSQFLRTSFRNICHSIANAFGKTFFPKVFVLWLRLARPTSRVRRAGQ